MRNNTKLFVKKSNYFLTFNIIVICDNATYHVSQKVKRFVANTSEELTLEHLPAYAPELNPDKQVWNHAKTHLGKLFIPSRISLVSLITNIMRSIQKTVRLVKSFLQLLDTKYAAI
jgi:transposase